MKTAMQELIWFMSDGLNELDEGTRASEVWNKAHELLEKEEQQITNAYQYAEDVCYAEADFTAEQYFNQFYKLNK